MRKSRGIKAESKFEVLKRMCSFVSVHAEETTTPTTTSEPVVNYEQLIANARQEEKNKLYPKIQKLEDANKGLITKSNEQLVQIGTLTAEKKDLENQIAEMKKSNLTQDEFNKLQKKIEELTAENTKLKEAPTIEEVESKIRAEYEVKSYIAEVKAANNNNLISAFAEGITGNTREEVDASLQKALEQSNKVREELGVNNNTPSPTGVNQPATNTNQVPQVANPTSNSGGTPASFDFATIQNMDVRSPEYAEFRKKMGLR